MARSRDVPQATAPAAHAGRSTRRQNREVASSAPDPAPRPASRRGQRASSVETSDEPQNTRQTRRQIQEAGMYKPLQSFHSGNAIVIDINNNNEIQPWRRCAAHTAAAGEPTSTLR